ncbi:hypothetical protein B0J17DRAFT_746273 [Rhizoctonia solani]|nr:hypothetical protein B0J17DRAFT_746273 [Rhizoctonia solani]
MAATKENPIIFYDLLSENGAWAPNPYRIRLTLNHKHIPYRLEYISFPDIARILEELGVKPANPVRGGEIKYTLPIIADPSPDPNGKPTYVADSFNIAIYLDKTYPAPKYPVVFAPGTHVVQKITYELFSNEVGYAACPTIIPLIARPGFFDEHSREYFLRTRETYFKQTVDTSIGSKFCGELHKKWDWFGEVPDLNEKGQFVMGKQVSFTDFAIGGIIFFVRRVEGGDMQIWKAIAEWQAGRWARHWAEIEQLEKNSSEVT